MRRLTDMLAEHAFQTGSTDLHCCAARIYICPMPDFCPQMQILPICWVDEMAILVDRTASLEGTWHVCSDAGCMNMKTLQYYVVLFPA